jgi:hypothetical protein
MNGVSTIMKQRAKPKIIVALLLFVALFAALWKASAPFRMKKQFEEQATTQLRGRRANPYSNRLKPDHVFYSVKVESIYHDLKLNRYLIKYTIRYINPKTKGVTILSSGYWVTGSDSYQGDCATFGGVSDSHFKVSLHP